jgi:isopenicillin N synthase-like dioxygenase
MSVPVIDLAPLRGGSDAERRDVARKIGDAARTVGFFCVTGHGMPAPLLADGFAHARRFFALPEDVKERVSFNGAFRGYAGFGSLTNGDVRESFDLGVDVPPEVEARFAGRPLVTRNRWPELPGFRASMMACFDASFAIFDAMHRAIAIDLGADPDFFKPQFGFNYGMRITRYPAVADPHAAFGASPHSDFGSLTLLAEDAPGLELQSLDGSWVPVDGSGGALVCNIGDCLMRWSNGSYRSTRHRVLNLLDRDRVSIGFFANADLDVTIGVLPSCTSADRPPQFEPVEFGTYMQSMFSEDYA